MSNKINYKLDFEVNKFNTIRSDLHKLMYNFQLAYEMVKVYSELKNTRVDIRKHHHTIYSPIGKFWVQRFGTRDTERVEFSCSKEKPETTFWLSKLLGVPLSEPKGDYVIWSNMSFDEARRIVADIDAFIYEDQL